jgi:transposase
MSKVHFIAMDTHSHTTDICMKTRADGPKRSWRVPTTIAAIREVIEQIERPRKLTFEEGPLADWLWRNLKGCVDEAVVCDPRKNALVAKDGDKDDPIDAEKLCQLQMGGFLRAVHHPQSVVLQLAKQTVGMYHERVAHRVRQSNKVAGLFKRWGVMVRSGDFADAIDRPKVLGRLGDLPEHEVVRGHIKLLLSGYDEAVRQEELLHREMVKLAKADEQVVRFAALPGIGWIRGLTIRVYLDTPFRFKSKQALWKYMGIGLVRERSGEGSCFVHVELGANRALKNAILGAAESVIMQGGNPFSEQFKRWQGSGLSRRNARRNVARSMACAMWGMWKNGGTYDPALVGCMPAGVR